MEQKAELHGGIRRRHGPGLETAEEEAASVVEGGPHVRGFLDGSGQHPAQEGRQAERRIQIGLHRRGGTYGSVVGMAHADEVGHQSPRRGFGGEKGETMQLRIGARLVTVAGGAHRPCTIRQKPEAHALRRNTVNAHRGESIAHARQPKVVGVIKRGGARVGDMHHARAAV